jgi:hypothetical protein
MADAGGRGALLWEAPGREVVCRVALGGDFLPAMGLGDDRTDWGAEARRVSDLVADCDVMFVNLEAPLECGDLPVRPKAGLGDTLDAPARALDYLAALGATVVGIANNHIFDHGAAGVERTRATVSERGMVALGSGHTAAAPPEIHVWSGPSSVRVGFWAAANNSGVVAADDAPGVEQARTERGIAALDEMRAAGAQTCVALLHAGCEGTNHPDPADAALLTSLVEAGFDLVAVCHSHRISGHSVVERAGDRPPGFCFHGLGSVASGCLYSELEREGLIAVLGVDRDGRPASVEVRPLALVGPGWGAVPDSTTARVILDRFSQVSDAIRDGSSAQQFYDDMSTGLMRRQLRDVRAAFRRGGLAGVLRKLGRLRRTHLMRLWHWARDAGARSRGTRSR